MAKRKKLTPTQKAYNAQVSRIKRFIKNAEKRGYRFEKTVIPPKPKRITKASVKKLKELTAEKLYYKSTYLTEEGEVVKGSRGRAQERRAAGKKAHQTRIRNQKGFEKTRRQADQQFYAQLQEDKKLQDELNEGKIVYSQIIQMINEVNKTHKKAASHLKGVLDGEIKMYGEQKTLRLIAENSREVLELAEIAIRYNPGDNRHDTAIRELLQLITGEIMSSQEARELQDMIDMESYV